MCYDFGFINAMNSGNSGLSFNTSSTNCIQMSPNHINNQYNDSSSQRTNLSNAWKSPNLYEKRVLGNTENGKHTFHTIQTRIKKYALTESMQEPCKLYFLYFFKYNNLS